MPDTTFTIENLENELGRLLSWIQAVETKISFIFPISTSMLGLLAALAPPFNCWNAITGIFSGISILLLFLSILFSALATFPRTSGPTNSLIFFGPIAAMDLEQYREAAKAQTKDDYIDDLIQQCHRNAQIAERKYSWVKRALACLFIAAIPWAMSVYVLYSNEV